MKSLLIGLSVVGSLLLSGCSNTQSNKTMDIDLMESMIEVDITTKSDVVAMFGQPTQTKMLTKTELHGYRKLETVMNAWSIVPFVGLVAGGMDERYKTCILKFKIPYDVVTNLSCVSESKFHSNSETMVGADMNMNVKMNIFGDAGFIYKETK